MKIDLPATTILLINTSDFFAEHTLVALLSLFGLVVGTLYFLRSKIGKRFFLRCTKTPSYRSHG